MKRHRPINAVLFFLAAVFIPCRAEAHLVTTGMGPVYDGIGHLLLTPEDLVPAVAIALYVGLRGKVAGRHVLFLFPLAWLAGGLAGLMSSANFTFQLPVLSFLLLGGIIAVDLRLPDNIITALSVLIGIIHGFYNGTAMAGGPGVTGLIGIMATLFVLVAIVSAFVISLKAEWTRIAVRVTGSWIAAVGLLMLGWLAKGSG